MQQPRKRRRIVLSAIITAALGGCDGSPTLKDREIGDSPAIIAADQPDNVLEVRITDGNIDRDHAAVGILRNGNSRRGCSGTLIGKHSVLTAAHCAGLKRFFIQGKYWQISRATEHPEYRRTRNRAYDIAVLELKENIETIEPARLSTRAPTVGTKIILVGFGGSQRNSNDGGIRRWARNTIAQLSSHMIAFDNTGSGTGNICSGDSGGPSFIEVGGNEFVAGVHSSATRVCGGRGVDVRVDVHQRWIRSVAAGDVSSTPTPPTPAPKDPTPKVSAEEGESCKKIACGAELSCTRVSRRNGGEIGRFCMEKCTRPGRAPECEDGESCVSAGGSLRVCFNPRNKDQGFTTPGKKTTQPSPATKTPPNDRKPPTNKAPENKAPENNAPGACHFNTQETQTLQLVNDERTKQGLDRVVCDAGAGRAARAHSQDMCDRGYFSHTSPEGTSFVSRLREANVDFSGGGENIAKGQRSPAAVHNAWMRSSGHRANILNPRWTRIGIGFVSCGGIPIWTQVFMGPTR